MSKRVIKFDNNDLELKRQIILSHYEKPTNKIKKKLDKPWVSIDKNSTGCIDNFSLYLKYTNNKIESIKFKGEGCAISTSATDIMCEKLKNMTIDDAIVYIDNYLNMVTGKKFDDKKLEELNVFSEIHKQFNRINCAKIGIEGIKSILLEIKNK